MSQGLEVADEQQFHTWRRADIVRTAFPCWNCCLHEQQREKGPATRAWRDRAFAHDPQKSRCGRVEIAPDRSRPSNVRRKQMPLIGYSLQGMSPSLGESDTRSGDEILNRARGQYLAGTSEAGDASRYVYRDSCDVFPE